MKQVSRVSIQAAFFLTLAIFSSGCVAAALSKARDFLDAALTVPVLEFRAWAERNNLPYPDIQVVDGPSGGTTIFSATSNSGGTVSADGWFIGSDGNLQRGVVRFGGSRR